MTLYIFDKDGTLIGSPEPGRPANTPDEQVVLPGVIEKLRDVRMASDKIAIASNQGGVAWGFITLEGAQSLIDDCVEKIGGVDAAYFSPYDSRAVDKNPDSPYAIDHPWRKPNPGMLLAIMHDMDETPENTIYIGDQESDRHAAENAGIRFIRADYFFGWSGTYSEG